jgi:hypothetical protein
MVIRRKVRELSEGPNNPESKDVVGPGFELAPTAAATTTTSIIGTSVVHTSSVGPIAVNQGPEDLAPPCDPLTTVAYESWMFQETSDAVLHHWQELPTDIIRYAVVEDAVLHARSLREIFLCLGQKDTISLKQLFPDLDTNIQRYLGLRDKAKAVRREYCHNNGRTYNYETLFNTRVLHPTICRGEYGLYREPLSRLRPKLLAVIDEIAVLEPSFRRLLASGRD